MSCIVLCWNQLKNFIIIYIALLFLLLCPSYTFTPSSDPRTLKNNTT